MYSVYPYMFDPDQLVFLISSVKEQIKVPGCFLEIGCAEGASTALLNRTLKVEGVERDYIALDTFGGFPDDQADYEVSMRGKSKTIKKSFTTNDMAWVDKSLKLAGISHVRLIRGDAATYDYSSLAPIAWCLLDVDLYLPTTAALPKLYDALSPGGLIVIDDCSEADERWDGALQAYNEFMASRGMEPEIVHRKLGIIRKPLAS